MAHASYKNAATKIIEDTVKQNLKRALPKEYNKKKIKRSSFGMTPTTENPLNLPVYHRQAPVVAFEATNMDQKFVFCVEKKDIFNAVVPLKEYSLS